MALYPFEADPAELRDNLDHYVTVIFGSLESDFLTLPKGCGFVSYPVFETGYEALKSATRGFQDFNPEVVRTALLKTPMIFIVLRAMLGFTPPEWAYMASGHTGVGITRNHARSLDRAIRLAPLAPRLV